MYLFLNCNDNPITFNKKNYLIRAAERLKIDWIKPYTGGQVENILNIEPYDFVKGTRWTGVWEIDLLLEPERHERYLDECNTAFGAITTENKRYVYLPQACDPILHKKVGDETHDWVHCGSTAGDGKCYEERQRRHELLKSFSHQFYEKHKRPDEYVSAISTARVQFIQSMVVKGQGEVAQRFFECLAIGAVLTNETEDLHRLGLEEGIDYEAYRTDDEMIEKMKILTEDEEKRKKIAKNAREKALLFHTYENRLSTIMQYVYGH